MLVLDAGHVAMYDTTSAVFARADELLQLGLSVPEVTKVFLRLREWGLDVPADVYTVPYAANILRGMLEKGRAHAERHHHWPAFPGTSPLHHMDPRAKIVLSIAYIVVLFMGSNALGLGLSVAFCCFCTAWRAFR